MSAVRTSRPAWRTAGAAVALVLLGSTAGVACGDDDDDNDAGAGTTESTNDEAATTTQPPGTEPDEVEPYITALLSQYDDVTNQIIADPSVANDRDDPLIQDYLDLVEPGSEAEGAIQTWVDNAEQGITVGPYSDDMPPFTTSLDGAIDSVSEDEVAFPTCEQQNYRQFDGQGRETEFVTGQSVPGQGTAVRVDGEWKLRRIDISESTLGCGDGVT